MSALPASAPYEAREAEAWNVRLVGYHDLQGRPALKLALQVVDDRWYLFLGGLWHSGVTILEVTDPSSPQFVRFVPGPRNTWSFQIQVAGGLMIQGAERPAQLASHGRDTTGIALEEWGFDPGAPSEEGIFVWDVSDATNPQQLSHFRTGTEIGTHRNFYDGGRYAHLAAGAPGFSRHIYRIVDLDDPGRPVEVGRWWLPEQWEAGGATTPKPTYWALHGPPYAEGDRAYLSYMKAGMVILDISVITAPRLVGRLDFGDAFGSRIGVHSVVPLPRRKLAVVNSESIQEGGSRNEPLNFAVIVDISDETAPRVISWLPVPEVPPGSPYRNFHEKGGRFGPHNQHHWQRHPDLESRDDRVYLSYFNAGLRIYEISDAYAPREIGYYVPPDPVRRIGPQPTQRLVTQSEDVLVDRRGFVYLTDKNWGVHILEYTGPTS